MDGVIPSHRTTEPPQAQVGLERHVPTPDVRNVALIHFKPSPFTTW